MLCIALHPFIFSHTSVSTWKCNGLQWQLTHKQTLSFSHTNMYSSWAVPHTGFAEYWAQPERKFLEYYNYFFILQRKNWLAIARGNQYWPPSDTRSRIKKRRRYVHTNKHIHPHTQSLLYSETKQHILKAPLPTITLPTIQGFSVWYGFKL